MIFAAARQTGAARMNSNLPEPPDAASPRLDYARASIAGKKIALCSGSTPNAMSAPGASRGPGAVRIRIEASPRERALAGLAALGGTPGERLDGMVAVVRRFVADEPDGAPLFSELLARSERARFAPGPADEEDCAALLAEARRVLAQAGEKAESGRLG